MRCPGSRWRSTRRSARAPSIPSPRESGAQIPSLLVAVASGMLVTRVASTGDGALGEDLGLQLSPRVLAGVAILLVGLGLVPGLPLAPFFVLGAITAAAAIASARTEPRGPSFDESGADAVRGPRLSITAPLP